MGGEGQTEWGAPKTWDGRGKQGKELHKHGRGGANRVRGNQRHGIGEANGVRNTKDMGGEGQTGWETPKTWEGRGKQGEGHQRHAWEGRGKQGKEHRWHDQEGWGGPGLCGVLRADMNEYCTQKYYTTIFSFSFVLQLRLMRSELSVEEVIKQRTLKVKF